MPEPITLDRLRSELAALQERMDTLCEAMELRFTRRDAAAQRLAQRVADTEQEMHYVKDDLRRAQADLQSMERNVAHLGRGW